jgi:uncharacterized protein (DUF2236 family)
MSIFPDNGLFGPASVSWRIHADPIAWVGGVRALFLQALHPRAMWGVAQNSNYRDDPWGRLMSTAGFVATVVYGTTDQATRAGQRVRGIHRRLRGVDPETGDVYRLDEPDLLRWVHCAQVESLASTALRVRLVDRHQADRYVDEQRRAAELIGLDPSSVPGCMADLDAYLAMMRPGLRATPEARDTAHFLLFPRPTQWWLRSIRLCWLPIGGLAFASLPVWARDMYAAGPWPSPDAVTILLRAARYAGFALPPRVRVRPETRSALRLQRPSHAVHQ